MNGGWYLPQLGMFFVLFFFFEIVDDKIHYETAVQKQIIAEVGNLK